MMFAMKLDGNKNLRKYSMFLSGLVLLQPLYLALNAVYFTIRRFHVPDSSVDLFISKLLNSSQFCYFLGMLLVAVYVSFVPQRYQKHNNILSIASNWATVVCSVLLLLSYVVKGEQGSLTFFYYMIAISSLVFSFNQGLVMNVSAPEIHWYAVAIPVSGIVVVVYQLTFLFFAEKLNIKGINLTIVTVQTVLAIFATIATSVLWTMTYFSADSSLLIPESFEFESSSFFSNLWMSKFPILITFFGLGYVYIVYPAIAPYKLTELRPAYRIDLLSVFAVGLSSTIIVFLCEYTNLGPNKNWRHTHSLWNYSTLLIIPYLLMPILFIVPLHYPNTKLAELMTKNKAFLGFFTIVFVVLHALMVTVGYSAASMQTNDQYNPSMTSFNTFFSYFFIVFIVLVSQGYLKTYKEFLNNSDTWATNDMKGPRAFFYWLGKSFQYGWDAFTETFSSDIKSDILKTN
uniref:Integral membrane protein, putative n=1 Tax=Theileria annulata TaxID=5874 RepID=A0A3B0NGS4_THEAN